MTVRSIRPARWRSSSRSPPRCTMPTRQGSSTATSSPPTSCSNRTTFAYLIDFGIARTAEDGVTQTGSTIGTWAYMAPERFRNDQINPSSDIYALACVLYECVTGQAPFPGNTFERVASGHIFAPPPRPSEVSRTIPTALDAVIARGLAKQPSDRYPTAVDMASAAREVVTRPNQPVELAELPQQSWPQPHALARRPFPTPTASPLCTRRPCHPPRSGRDEPAVCSSVLWFSSPPSYWWRVSSASWSSRHATAPPHSPPSASPSAR